MAGKGEGRMFSPWVGDIAKGVLDGTLLDYVLTMVDGLKYSLQSGWFLEIFRMRKASKILVGQVLFLCLTRGGGGPPP